MLEFIFQYIEAIIHNISNKYIYRYLYFYLISCFYCRKLKARAVKRKRTPAREIMPRLSFHRDQQYLEGNYLLDVIRRQ